MEEIRSEEEVKNNNLQKIEVLDKQIHELSKALHSLEQTKGCLFAEGYEENKHTIRDIQKAIDALAISRYHAETIKNRILLS